MFRGFAFLAAPLVALTTLPAAAHPHVFIDAGLEIRFNDQGQLTHVKVTWAYDAFYSLLLTQNRGLDADGDGFLTPDEEQVMTGFDAQWIEGYNGDLVMTLDGQPLRLSGPLEPTATMIDGQLVSTHLREVAGTPVVAGDKLSVKVFDETFYTAYDLTRPVDIVGAAGCEMLRIEPNVNDELLRKRDIVAGFSSDADISDQQELLIGEAFATELLVTCPAS